MQSNIKKYLLPLGFSVIVALMVFSSFLTDLQIRKSIETMANIDTVKSNNYRYLDSITHSSLENSKLLLEINQSKNNNQSSRLKKRLTKSCQELESSLSNLEKSTLTTHQAHLLDLLKSLNTDNNRRIEAVLNPVIPRKQTFVDNIISTYKQILETVDAMHVSQTLFSQKAIDEAKNIGRKSLDYILVFNIFSVFITLFLMASIFLSQRKRNRELSYLANTDTLTGLSNRASFIRSIKRTIRRDPGSLFTIVFIDIDYFKNINDNYGHTVGDIVLKYFAGTINQSITQKDILARFGRDEFVLLLRSVNTIKSIKAFLSQLSQELDRSFIINGNEIFITSSIGASIYPKDSINAKSLLKHADIAMYTAKEAGRNCHRLFSKQTNERLRNEHKMSHALHTILKSNNKNKELFLYFQPLVNINDQGFSECEALIRWRTKEGLQNTGEFIALAEKSNLIEKVNLFVINEAFEQQISWQKNGIKNIRININLSGNKQIFHNLFNYVSQQLEATGLDPALFGLELTERTIFEISKEMIEELEVFRQRGMKISIDDFGTGYSSLSYLKDLPITTLKIDQQFIASLPDDETDKAIVKAIITLAHSLHLDIIAEGVETAEQLAFLEKHHSSIIAQGYYFHKPLSADEIGKLKLAA